MVVAVQPRLDRRPRVVPLGASRHRRAPLLDALWRYRERGTVPFSTPGHKLGGGVDPELRRLLGADVFAADVWLEHRRPRHLPARAAETLAADAWGADRTFFLSTAPPPATTPSSWRRSAGRRGDRRPRHPQVAARRADPDRGAAGLRRPAPPSRAQRRPRHRPRRRRRRPRRPPQRQARRPRQPVLLRCRLRPGRRSPRSPTPAASRSTSTRRGDRISTSTPPCRPRRWRAGSTALSPAPTRSSAA